MYSASAPHSSPAADPTPSADRLRVAVTGDTQPIAEIATPARVEPARSVFTTEQHETPTSRRERERLRDSGPSETQERLALVTGHVYAGDAPGGDEPLGQQPGLHFGRGPAARTTGESAQFRRIRDYAAAQALSCCLELNSEA